jgi:hypothetical protein
VNTYLNHILILCAAKCFYRYMHYLTCSHVKLFYRYNAVNISSKNFNKLDIFSFKQCVFATCLYEIAVACFIFTERRSVNVIEVLQLQIALLTTAIYRFVVIFSDNSINKKILPPKYEIRLTDI